MKVMNAGKQELPADFKCPANMRHWLAKVFAGEYDIPIENNEEGKGFRILDIGANCGAFALWAARRWPHSEIHCFEPMPDSFAFLTQNLELVPGAKIQATQAAVTGTQAGSLRMHLGKHNSGEASLFKFGGQLEETVEVPTVPIRELPHADILKIDAEGAELEILPQLIGMHGRQYIAVLVEYHSEFIRRVLDTALGQYHLVRSEVTSLGIGTACYINAGIQYHHRPDIN